MGATTKHASVESELLESILVGKFPAGSRLPAERELAEDLSSSRGTLREALRGLESLGVVRPRRGSGVEVLDYRKTGRVGLIPAFLRAGAPGDSALQLLGDLLALRRILAREVLIWAARRHQPGDLNEVRRLVERAWSLRADSAAFVQADLDVFAALAQATRVLPLVWIINTFQDTVRELAEWVGAPAVDSQYLDVMLGVLHALECGDGAAAQQVLGGFYERLDTNLMGGLT